LRANVAPSSADPRRSFIDWGRATLAPLSSIRLPACSAEWTALGAIIGNTPVVALSEGVHCAAEPLEFRNRLFEYLVRDKGFTAIAIESGIVESRVIHEFVRGKGDDLNHALSAGISWNFDRLPPNRALVQWLRDHNDAARGSRKVNFYGFDVAGSPGNPAAARGVDAAIMDALGYLSSVDPGAAAGFRAQLEPLFNRLRFSARHLSNGPGYECLSRPERDGLTATIADLVSLLEFNEGKYKRAASAGDYAWGHRAAIAARQVDAWLRHIPLGWQPFGFCDDIPDEAIEFLGVAREVRDRAQADNLAWILEQEGPAGKVLVFASLYHLSGAEVTATTAAGAKRGHAVAGTYLRQRLGGDLLSIGNLIGAGESGCAQCRVTLERANLESIDGCAAELGTPLFWLDLRSAPASVADWLMVERRLAHSPQLELALQRAFDVVFYTDVVSAACDPSGTAAIS
jgi:erythromycin esterase